MKLKSTLLPLFVICVNMPNCSHREGAANFKGHARVRFEESNIACSQKINQLLFLISLFSVSVVFSTSLFLGLQSI